MLGGLNRVTNVWGASRPELSTGTCLLSVGWDGEVGEERDVWGELILKGLVEVPKPELGGGRRAPVAGNTAKVCRDASATPGGSFSVVSWSVFFFLFLSFFLEREREEWGRGRQRERESFWGAREGI